MEVALACIIFARQAVGAIQAVDPIVNTAPEQAQQEMPQLKASSQQVYNPSV